MIRAGSRASRLRSLRSPLHLLLVIAVLTRAAPARLEALTGANRQCDRALKLRIVGTVASIPMTVRGQIYTLAISQVHRALNVHVCNELQSVKINVTMTMPFTALSCDKKACRERSGSQAMR